MAQNFQTRFGRSLRLRPAARLLGGGALLSGCEPERHVAGTQVADPPPNHYRDFPSADRLASYLQSPPHPLVAAHRGGPAEGVPENATETFAHALSHGPQV